MAKSKKTFFTFVILFLISMSVHAQSSTVFLKDPHEAINSRIAPLLGRKLTTEEINSLNPYIKIDETLTPKLKTIVLSSLVISHDYIGTLLFRLLEHHALQGSQVYVMTTKRFVFQKEKQWIEKFKKTSSNIHFVEYRNSDAKTLWSKVQTTNHVKIFLTIDRDETHCRLINGGRNTSDMYFFNEKPDHSAHPEMVQWGEENYEWGYFDDLEVESNNCSDVRIVSDVFKDYFENYLGPKSYFDESFILNINGDKGLEKKYVSFIENAESSIRILSPYINFTDKIFKALLSAKKRGVQIEIISAKSLSNDYLPVFLQIQQNHNLKNVVKHFDVYLYDNKNYIPHAKALLIDDSILSIGSVNMNKRSFIYDNEFTQMISDKDLIQKFNAIYSDSFKAYSFKIDKDYKFESNALILPLKIFDNSF